MKKCNGGNYYITLSTVSLKQKTRKTTRGNVMIKHSISKRLEVFERMTGERADGMRDILHRTPGGFFSFYVLAPSETYRGKLPKDVYHLAHIYASKHRNCRTCLQKAVACAMQDEVPKAQLRAAIRDEKDALRPDLRLVAEFTRAMQKGARNVDVLRTRMVQQLGECAVDELVVALGDGFGAGHCSCLGISGGKVQPRAWSDAPGRN